MPIECLTDPVLKLPQHIAGKQPLVRGGAVVKGRRDCGRIADLPVLADLGTNAEVFAWVPV